MGAGGSSQEKTKEREQELAAQLKRIVQETHYELLTPPNIIKRLEEHFQARLTPEQKELIGQAVERALGSHFRTHYRVGPILGKGGYSTVHACTHAATKQECAVKVIDKAKLSRNALKGLTEEIRIMQTLKHDRLIRLHEVFDHGSTLYLVMERVEGGELFDEIVRLTRYSERDAAQLMFNFLDGLGYMHAQGYCHRDIKPENLLLMRKPRDPGDVCKELKIADFGFSAYVGDQDTLTTCCGTPRYIAPEVLNVGLFHKGTGYGKSCDMWAVGVIAYILLFGKAPFYHKDRDQLWRHICHGVWQMPAEAATVSREAQDFIQKLIVVDTQRRYTCVQSLKHPFVKGRTERPTEHLQTTHEALKNFNAREKFKGAVFGMQSLSRVAYIQKSLALGVKANTTIVKQLDNGALGDDTEDLDLGQNYVGAKGLVAILEMVREGCPNLRSLSCAGNNVNNAVIDVLVEVAAVHPKLEAIDLSGNPLSYKAGQALLTMVKKNPRIKTLKLNNTKIQEGLLRQITQQVDHNASGQPRDYFAKGIAAKPAGSPPAAPAPP